MKVLISTIAAFIFVHSLLFVAVKGDGNNRVKRQAVSCGGVQCYNGASCVQNSNLFSCSCTSGFTGTFCNVTATGSGSGSGTGTGTGGTGTSSGLVTNPCSVVTCLNG